MPRNYIRKKPEMAPITECQLAQAKQLLEKGKSKRAVANAIGISESCLRKRLKFNTAASSMGRFKPTFNAEQEAEFVQHCKQMDNRYIGLTINDLRRLAYEYAEANKIENRFDNELKMAGRDWVESFLKRHQILETTSNHSAVVNQPTDDEAQNFSIAKVGPSNDDLEGVLDQSIAVNQPTDNANNIQVEINNQNLIDDLLSVREKPSGEVIEALSVARLSKDPCTEENRSSIVQKENKEPNNQHVSIAKH